MLRTVVTFEAQGMTCFALFYENSFSMPYAKNHLRQQQLPSWQHFCAHCGPFEADVILTARSLCSLQPPGCPEGPLLLGSAETLTGAKVNPFTLRATNFKQRRLPLLFLRVWKGLSLWRVTHGHKFLLQSQLMQSLWSGGSS